MLSQKTFTVKMLAKAPQHMQNACGSGTIALTSKKARLRNGLPALLIGVALTTSFAQNLDLASIMRKAAAGDAKSQFELARAYSEGNGVPKDFAKSLEWLKKSALQGYSGAEVNLGYMYQMGGVKGIEKNPHEAAKWYRKSIGKRQNSPNDASNAQKAEAHLKEMVAQGLIAKQEADWHSSETHSPAANDAKKNNKSLPFSLAEVETGITGGITNHRMTTLVTTYGVDFPLNDHNRKRLSDDGADDDLLATIAASRR